MDIRTFNVKASNIIGLSLLIILSESFVALLFAQYFFSNPLILITAYAVVPGFWYGIFCIKPHKRYVLLAYYGIISFCGIGFFLILAKDFMEIILCFFYSISVSYLVSMLIILIKRGLEKEVALTKLPTAKELKTLDEAKERHGCLTFWIYLAIIFATISDSFTKLHLYFDSDKQNLHILCGLEWYVISGVILTILYIVFAIALLNWKKYGFYGLLGTQILNFVFNISYGKEHEYKSIYIIMFIIILFILLKLRNGETCAWDNLE